MTMTTTIITHGILAGSFGLLLGYAAIRFKVEGDPVVDKVDKILPQQQCGKCGYPGCRPYAEAIVTKNEAINRCPPGGEAGMLALADLLDREPKPLEGEYQEPPLQLAVIDESACIGCTLCIKACPVDAILGTAKQMHTVIDQECTGCELCVEPCPVSCITMITVAQTTTTWKWPYPVIPLVKME